MALFNGIVIRRFEVSGVKNDKTFFTSSSKHIVCKAQLHSLPKVKHGEENADFRKQIKIEEHAIRCRGGWKYEDMLGYS